MKTGRFRGGIHPPSWKESTRLRPIRSLPLPDKLYLLLLQHTGTPLVPLVVKGDRVKRGQKIADVEAYISAPLHAPVAGKVLAIEDWPHPCQGKFPAIVIENDHTEEEEKRDPLDTREIEALDRSFLREWIREGGLVGLGGAAFPTHVKVSPPEGKTIDTLILNGAECEPFLTADERVMIEDPENILLGGRILKQCCGAGRLVIALEDNKSESERSIRRLLDKDPGVAELITLPTRYPQGSEKHLILSLLKRWVPPGGLPFDVGVVVSNVQTSRAVGRMAREGLPLIDRVITVSGDAISQADNLSVPLGMRLIDILEGCGGLKTEPRKIIMGGPMTGIAQVQLDVPVVKGTSGFLFMSEITEKKEFPCIRCGRCVSTCPMNLVPSALARFSEFRAYDEARNHYALDCIECGVCAYGCPSGIPLTHHIKQAKAEILRKSRKGSQ
ncbi:MAG TPA: electron transport complex subunit RsxC [Atribacteraceae bacterium]|nr:electron transport complex subunit RsxC [Atribacteraceae bacterium]